MIKQQPYTLGFRAISSTRRETPKDKRRVLHRDGGSNIEYERAEGLLAGLYVCGVSVSDCDQLATRVVDISGVVNVRE